MKKKMKPIQILACSIATLGTLTLSTLAQQASPTPSSSPGMPENGRPHRPVPPAFKALDTDKDGTLSNAELAAAPTSLKTLDANGDGQLSPGELRPKRPSGEKSGSQRDGNAAKQGDESSSKSEAAPHRGPGGPHGPHGPHGRPPGPDPLVRALDTDDDGIISATEIAAASTSLKALDKNSDGQLTRDELRPQGPPPPPPEEEGAPGDAPQPSPAAQ